MTNKLCDKWNIAGPGHVCTRRCIHCAIPQVCTVTHPTNCTHTHVCLRMRTHAGTTIYKHMHTHTQNKDSYSLIKHAHAHIVLYMYLNVHTHTQTRTCVCTGMHTHIYTCAYNARTAYTHTQTCMLMHAKTCKAVCFKVCFAPLKQGRSLLDAQTIDEPRDVLRIEHDFERTQARPLVCPLLQPPTFLFTQEVSLGMTGC